MPTDGNMRGQSGGSSSGLAQASTATIASIIYVSASRHFAARAESLDDLEAYDAADSAQRSAIETELQNVALASVMMAYFSVEALLNEIFLAHSLGMIRNFRGLDASVAARLSAGWDAGARKLSPPEKADLALVIADCKPLDWGAGTPQRFGRLHDLRNELVHHKPRWVVHGNSGPESDNKLERQLHQQFSPTHIWKGRGVPFRWNGCLGGPCARWAHDTSVAFCAEVCKKLSIQLYWLKA